MSKVVLTGFTQNLKLVSLVRLIRDMGNMSLSEAKGMIDSFVGTRNLQLTLETEQEAQEFLVEAEKLGFFGHIEKADGQEA